MDDDGKVVVDQEERTSAPNVYAIGDVAKVHIYQVYLHVIQNVRSPRNTLSALKYT